MRPRVVFHADDLGISEGVNRGVERSLAAGLVRAVSVCVTGEALEDGARRLERFPDVDVGLHLSLTLGRAVSGPIEGLTDAVGAFPERAAVLTRCALGLPVRAQLRRELRAQLARAEAAGLTIDHLDGHHHAHAFPVVRDVVAEEAARRGLRVRVSRDADPRASGLRARVLELLEVGRHGDLPFTGLTLWGQPDYEARLLALLRDPPAEAFEIAVHPREEDDALRRLDHLAGDTHAAAELDALTLPDRVARIRALCLPSRFADL